MTLSHPCGAPAVPAYTARGAPGLVGGDGHSPLTIQEPVALRPPTLPRLQPQLRPPPLPPLPPPLCLSWASGTILGGTRASSLWRSPSCLLRTAPGTVRTVLVNL